MSTPEPRYNPDHEDAPECRECGQPSTIADDTCTCAQCRPAPEPRAWDQRQIDEAWEKGRYRP